MLAVALFLLSIPVDEIAFAKGSEVWLVNHDGGSPAKLVDDASYERPLVWSPNGESLIYWSHSSGKCDLKRYALDDGSAVNLTKEMRGGSHSASFSPDGSTIAFMHDGDPMGLYVMKPDGTGKRHITDKGHKDFPPRWSKDGKSVVILDLTETGSHLLIVSLADRQVKLLSDGRDAYRLQDNEWLILGRGGKGENLAVVDAVRLHRWRFPWQAESPVCFAKSPRRNQLALGDGNELVIFELLAPGEPRRFDFAALVRSVSWSSDGARLAVSVKAEEPEIWVVEWASGAKTKIAKGEYATFRPKKL